VIISPLISTREQKNQRDSGAYLIPVHTQTIYTEKDAYNKTRFQKASHVVLALFLMVTATQAILAWYSMYYTKCKLKKEYSATLAPFFIFGVSIAEVVFSSCIALITLTKKRSKWISNARKRLSRLVKTCLVVLFVVSLLLVIYVEFFSREYADCELKKLLLKIQAVLTLVRGTLFIVVGHL